MPAANDLNNRIAKAKGWTWLEKAERRPRHSIRGIVFPETMCLWRKPDGDLTTRRPNYVGTLEGVGGLMRELQEKEYDWAMRWSALFQLWDVWAVGDSSHGRLVQFQSTKEEGFGVAVGRAWMSVHGKDEPMSASKRSPEFQKLDAAHALAAKESLAMAMPLLAEASRNLEFGVPDLLAHIEAQAKQIAELQAALKVTWVPCEERMPGDDGDVWVYSCDIHDIRQLFVASWDGDLWWDGDEPLPFPPVTITHWAEIRWPEPPQKEGGGNE